MIALNVIDVSHYELHPDIVPRLARAGDDGVHGVIAQATYGTHWTDKSAATFLHAARDLGMVRAAYCFGDGRASGVEQAKHLLAELRGLGLNQADIRHVLDFEGDRKGVTMQNFQARAFMQTIHGETGRWPVLYVNRSFCKRFTRPDDIARNCPLWLASYGGTDWPSVPVESRAVWSAVTLWQFTDGHVGPADEKLYPRETPGFGRIDRNATRTTDLGTLWGTLGGNP